MNDVASFLKAFSKLSHDHKVREISRHVSVPTLGEYLRVNFGRLYSNLIAQDSVIDFCCLSHNVKIILVVYTTYKIVLE